MVSTVISRKLPVTCQPYNLSGNSENLASTQGQRHNSDPILFKIIVIISRRKKNLTSVGPSKVPPLLHFPPFHTLFNTQGRPNCDVFPLSPEIFQILRTIVIKLPSSFTYPYFSFQNQCVTRGTECGPKAGLGGDSSFMNTVWQMLPFCYLACGQSQRQARFVHWALI